MRSATSCSSPVGQRVRAGVARRDMRGAARRRRLRGLLTHVNGDEGAAHLAAAHHPGRRRAADSRRRTAGVHASIGVAMFPTDESEMPTSF